MSLLINFYANFLQNEPKSSKIANVLLQSAKTSVKIGNCMLMQVQLSSAAITIQLILALPESQKYASQSQVQVVSEYDNGMNKFINAKLSDLTILKQLSFEF
ncbi:hypothetical protein TTHERM_000225987 (macronuclear) [Tetrahymena thermophila SB210]|uniref:Uncharacterized protein n=1 Tax=Tetrahymena thermophila (strain SB210) TaxID=312017 RepID=W7XDL2_TETTS|nr:hypothetical protein TTHERM_000225987 [Tetrahymena thermophila SB210]EWS74733.1 hypothetical protein TTHERM_000225987 [Tetrahymena thermophila SB210]|eukprot:XP_012652734.1 hypothetical protein TTHERM_000225987 [Tetrahymena thermophila SB210]